MNRFSLFCIVGFVCSSAYARPDRNAFLNVKVRSVPELVKQAKADRAVMDRYRRHYHMTASQVVTYLSSLRPTRLEKGGVYQVYSVPPNNIIKVHAQKFRAGTPVYVDEFNRPAMIVKCGNPLSLGPQSPVVIDHDNDLKGDPSEELRDISNEDFETPSSQDLIEALTPTTPEFGPDPVITTGDSNIPVVAALAPGLGLWPYLIGLVGAGGIIVVTTDGDNNIIPPVPEPLTLAVVGAGLAAVVSRRRKRSL